MDDSDIRIPFDLVPVVVIVLVVLTIGGCLCCYFTGRGEGEAAIRGEAVKNGHGVWAPRPVDGWPEFRWSPSEQKENGK